MRRTCPPLVGVLLPHCDPFRCQLLSPESVDHHAGPGAQGRVGVVEVGLHALGAGLLVALAADLRICSTDAVLGLLAARYGLFPALGTFRLPRLIGLGPARRLILSGETVDPEEAYRLGLVDHLVPAGRFAEGVDELVARYAALSPAAAAAIKHLTARAFDTTRDAALADAVPLLQRCLAAPHVADASAVWRARSAGRS